MVEQGQDANFASSTTEIRHHRSSVEEIVIMTSFNHNKSNYHQMLQKNKQLKN